MPPSPNGPTGGRNARGRFTEGNPGGPGNPNAARVAEWRQALVDTVSREDLGGVLRKLVEQAKAGEPWAVREILNRTLGKVVEATDPADSADPPDLQPVIFPGMDRPLTARRPPED